MKQFYTLKVFSVALLGSFLLGSLGCSDDSTSQTSSVASIQDSKKEAPSVVANAVATPAQQQATQQSAADVKQPVAPHVEISGESLYATCVGCHGASGEGGVGPKLRGQSKADLIKKIKGYRDGKQFGSMTSMMASNVQNLSDEEVERVVSYILKM